MLKLFHLAAAAALFLCASAAQASEQPQEWSLVTPTGAIKQSAIDPAPRLASLEGKTIALRWNGKNNGDVVLKHLGELISKKYPSVKLLHTYADNSQNLNTISGTPANSQRIAKVIADMKADLVIASQAD